MMGDILLFGGLFVVACGAFEAWKHPGSEAIRHWRRQRTIKERLRP